MKFYRINYFASCETDQSTEWATSLAAAEKIARANRCGDYEPTIKVVEIEPTKAGILAFLNDNIITNDSALIPWT